jgi:hypothetical protein
MSCPRAFPVYEDFERVRDILGVRLKTTPVRLMGGGTRQKHYIWYSGFWSQGDGARFEGYLNHAKGAAARIRDYAPTDATLQGIADQLQGSKRWGGRPPAASMCQGSGC